MAKERIVLIVEDAADRSKLVFKSWADAHNHIRTVILGQIVNEFYELALQEDPGKWKETMEELKDIAHSINYPKDKEELKGAVELWNDYAGDQAGFTTIEIL